MFLSRNRSRTENSVGRPIKKSAGKVVKSTIAGLNKTSWRLESKIANQTDNCAKVFCKDLDNDGNKELIIGRSGTESGNRFGTRGYFVQIISHVNGELIDKTSEFIQDNYEVGVDGQPDCQLDLKVNGIDRLHDLDGNGRLDLYNIPPDDFRKFLHWEWNGSRFIKVSP